MEDGGVATWDNVDGRGRRDDGSGGVATWDNVDGRGRRDDGSGGVATWDNVDGRGRRDDGRRWCGNVVGAKHSRATILVNTQPVCANASPLRHCGMNHDGERGGARTALRHGSRWGTWRRANGIAAWITMGNVAAPLRHCGMDHDGERGGARTALRCGGVAAWAVTSYTHPAFRLVWHGAERHGVPAGTASNRASGKRGSFSWLGLSVDTRQRAVW
jgi:hypothetical protein